MAYAGGDPLPPLPKRTAPLTDEEIRAAWVVEPPTLTSPIELVDYDPRWPAVYAAEEHRIRQVLGDRALAVEHVGSTSIPDLPAKPIIDIDLIVGDSSDEGAYIPELEAAGYVLTVREPSWYEHRCLKGAAPNVNLHVFSPGCDEHRRHVVFRDWLRGHPDDRDRYAETKRQLAGQPWGYIQNYADAKTEIVIDILRRAGCS